MKFRPQVIIVKLMFQELNTRMKIHCKNVKHTKIIGIFNTRIDSKTKIVPQY